MIIQPAFFQTKGIDHIQFLRNELERKFNEKKCLHDPEVVAASQILDQAINEYQLSKN